MKYYNGAFILHVQLSDYNLHPHLLNQARSIIPEPILTAYNLNYLNVSK